MPADLSNEEAREADTRQWVTVSSVATRKNALAAYRTAVRATLLASLIEKVEAELRAVKDDDPNHDGGELRCSDCVEFDFYLRVLTLLRTEAETDGNV